MELSELSQRVRELFAVPAYAQADKINELFIKSGLSQEAYVMYFIDTLKPIKDKIKFIKSMRDGIDPLADILLPVAEVSNFSIVGGHISVSDIITLLENLKVWNNKSGCVNEPKSVNEVTEIIDESDDYISPALLERVRDVEEKIKIKIGHWRQGLDKIGCAAFVERLSEIYFKPKYKNKNKKYKYCKEFAKMRYNGIDLQNQFHSKETNSRAGHGQSFNKYFN